MKKTNSSNSTGKQGQQQQYIDLDDFDLRSQTQVTLDNEEQMQKKIKQLQEAQAEQQDNSYIDIARLSSAIYCKGSAKKQMQNVCVEQGKCDQIVHQAGIYNKVKNMQNSIIQHQVNRQLQDDDSPCSIIKTSDSNKIIMSQNNFQAQDDQNNDLQSNYYRKQNGNQNVVRRTIMLKPMNEARIVQQRSKSKSARPSSGKNVIKSNFV